MRGKEKGGAAEYAYFLVFSLVIRNQKTLFKGNILLLFISRKAYIKNDNIVKKNPVVEQWRVTAKWKAELILSIQSYRITITKVTQK